MGIVCLIVREEAVCLRSYMFARLTIEGGCYGEKGRDT